MQKNVPEISRQWTTGRPPDTAKIDGATRQWTDRWTS